MPGSKPRRLRRPVSGSWAARWRRLSSWRADSIALIAWFANARSACSDSSEGSWQSSGSSTHTMPASRPSRSCSGTTSQWWYQARGPRPLLTERVDARGRSGGVRRSASGRVHHDAAVAHEGRVEQRRQDRRAGTPGSAATCSAVKPTPDSGTRCPPGWSARNTITFWKPSASRMPSQTASSISSAELRPVSWEDTRRRCSTAARWRRPSAVLWACLDRDRDVRGDGAEQLELDLGGAAAGDGLVDRDDAEHLAGRGPQRDHQRVVGVPRARLVDDRDVRCVGPQPVAAPVVLAGGHEVGAVAEEARGEQRVPVGPARGLAHQQLARLLVAEHDDDLEVVPGRAVEVDDDRAIAERAGDGGGHRGEHRRERVAGAHGRGDVEQTAQAVERCGVTEPGREIAHPGVSVKPG